MRFSFKIQEKSKDGGENMTEREIQKRIVQRLKDLGLLFLHVPNEGKRNPKTAALLKSMGMRRGAPDLLIFDSPLDGSKGLGTI